MLQYYATVATERAGYVLYRALVYVSLQPHAVSSLLPCKSCSGIVIEFYLTMGDNTDDFPAQTASESSTSSVSLSSLKTALKSCDVEENFILASDISLDMRPVVELNRDDDAKISSKLSLSYQGRLYGKIEITSRKPMAILNDREESWRAFESELRFIATHFCHWHSHPNIIRYYGVAILGEDYGGCVPHLLSESVKWTLFSLLEDKYTKLTQRDKVSIIHDIASGLSFLHLRRPRAIVHAALNTTSVLLDKRYNAKLTNFFHSGYEGDSLTVVSEKHKPRLSLYNADMKLDTSLDMKSLGYIIKAIDTPHKNREQVRGWRNVLEDFYMLYDHDETGPPQNLTACEVSRKLGDYLEEPQRLSVSLSCIVL